MFGAWFYYKRPSEKICNKNGPWLPEKKKIYSVSPPVIRSKGRPTPAPSPRRLSPIYISQPRRICLNGDARKRVFPGKENLVGFEAVAEKMRIFRRPTGGRLAFEKNGENGSFPLFHGRR